MAFFIPEITTAWLWTHAEPWRAPIKLGGVGTMHQLARTAEPGTRPAAALGEAAADVTSEARSGMFQPGFGIQKSSIA